MRGIFLATALMASACAFAQEPLRPEQRQELWLSGAVTTRLPYTLRSPLGNHYKRIRVRSELGYRSSDVFFAGRQVFLDVNMRYRAAKWLTLAYEHRFAARTGRPGLRQRSILQAEAERTFGRTTANYRFIYQHNYVDWGGQREVFRNRVQLGYDFKKWKLDPEVSVEFFTWAGNKGLSYFGTRWQLGTQYKLSKGHAVTAALVHDRERDKAWPTHRWITSITYTLNLRDL